MKWGQLLKMVGHEPFFYSSLLRAGPVSTVDLGKQLSRWVKAGSLLKIRRGLYAFPAECGQTRPHPFALANQMKKGSYVSLQSALAYYHLIPEYVAQVTSITTGRPETVSNPLGDYIFKHVKRELFFGFQTIELVKGQAVFIARPEKALLDLVYLTAKTDLPNYLQELRLQNSDILKEDNLWEFANKSDCPKLQRSVPLILAHCQDLQKQ
jgi:predicted transcriptional regulator of viral defense system